MGRCYGERRSFVDKLRRKGINITTFGQGWKDGDRISQADLIKIYNQNKISLNFSLTSQGHKTQIKTRDFEIPACGGLLLTQDTKEIAEYFVPRKEIITYKDTNDVAEKLKYYLEHDEERKNIAQAGYRRTLHDHTYEKRFNEIFYFLNRIDSKKPEN